MLTAMLAVDIDLRQRRTLIVATTAGRRGEYDVSRSLGVVQGSSMLPAILAPLPLLAAG